MGMMKIKISKVHADWEKHNYINNTNWNVTVLNYKDQISHCTVLPAHSRIQSPHPTSASVTMLINNLDVITDATGLRYVFSPQTN